MDIKNMKMEDLMTDKVYNMCDILRFSTRKRLHEESVATHSFIVTYQAMVLGEVLNLNDSDKLLLMQMSVCHDLEEVFTTDVISPVKKAIPELEKALTKYGRENVTREFSLLNNVLERYYEEEDKQTSLWQIMKLADYLSVLYYVDRELEFGSKAEDIMEIKVEMTKTCRELWEKIKSWDIGEEEEENKEEVEQEVVKKETYVYASTPQDFHTEFVRRDTPKYITIKPYEELSEVNRVFCERNAIFENEMYLILGNIELVDFGDWDESLLPIKKVRIYVGFDEYVDLPGSCIKTVLWEV